MIVKPNTKPKPILALDASTSDVGWVLGEHDTDLTFGTFEPTGNDPWDRICQVGDFVFHMFQNRGPIDFIGYEVPMPAGKNPDTDRKLGALMGAVLMSAHIGGLGVIHINTATVIGTGYHKNAIRNAAALLKVQTCNGHEADAVGVWMATHHVLWERDLLAGVERAEK